MDYERFEQAERKRMMENPIFNGLKIFIGNTDQVCREYEKLMNPANDDLPEVEFMACPQWENAQGELSYNGIMMVVRYYDRPAKFPADPA